MEGFCPLKKNSEFIATVEGYNSSGDGVFRINGYAVFVPLTLFGEVWRIKIVKVTNTAVYGKRLELLQSSQHRIEPDCPYFGICGGCDCRHMDYSSELSFKLDKVNDSLKRIGHQSVCASEILSSELIERYRNKAVFNVCNTPDGIGFGFFHERTHDLIQIGQCLLQNEFAERSAACIIDFMTAHHFMAYEEENGTGTVRHIVCRNAVYTQDHIVCIVSARGFGVYTDELVNSLLYHCPEITGIVLCINKGRINSILDGTFYTLYGNPDLTDYLGRYLFEISPRAFYQINPPQAEKLYAKAVEYASAGKTDSCLELYCGSGTISMFLSEHFKTVFATEIVPDSIGNANDNANRNDINNIRFLCGDAAETANFVKESGMQFDCVVVDPPRKGMDEAAVNAVASISPERVVYVSCNPSTLARDIVRFNERGYTLQKVTAVDMFPRTCHVETVVLMSRK